MTEIVSNDYSKRIKAQLTHCITDTHYEGQKHVGKVRDNYDLGSQLAIFSTDRLSGFDRHLANIPFKGEVLNRLSAWWFQQTQHIIANHVIAVLQKNLMLVKKCEVFAIEVIMRGYLSGSTQTSLWQQYQLGLRQIDGINLADGLTKNQRLARAIMTPTTKEREHDRPISPVEIIKQQLISPDDWQVIDKAARALFAYGQQVAAKHGLILVDTKYEFGKDSDGNIVLIDELHTPDSSRYWLANDYQRCLQNQQEPENFDKELIRLWYKKHCDPYTAIQLPKAPQDLIIRVASNYIRLYEMLTEQPFFSDGEPT